jgi:hypothetical protein
MSYIFGKEATPGNIKDKYVLGEEIGTYVSHMHCAQSVLNFLFLLLLVQDVGCLMSVLVLVGVDTSLHNNN